MSNITVVVAALVILASGHPASGKSTTSEPNSVVGEDEVTVCEYYNATCIAEAKITGGSVTECYGEQICYETSGSSHICYAVWVNETLSANDSDSDSHGIHRSGYRVKMMGCFTLGAGGQSCVQKDRCLEDREDARNGGSLFCCCQGNKCNANFEWIPRPSEVVGKEIPIPPANVDVEGSENPSEEGFPLLPLMYALVPIFLLMVVVSVVIYVYRQRRKASRFSAVPATNMNGEGEDGEGMRAPNGALTGARSGVQRTPLSAPKMIELIEIKARGRFGAVWKGRLGDNSSLIAVKIFPLQDRSSWLAEQEIYNLPRMDHENILKFLGVEKRGESLQMEFWLTTEFHEKGSLCDFLKAHVVSWDDLCRIAYSIARGLTHLHEEIPQSGSKEMKPAIAHRDFKSKNVLIKSDMTACLADFGLALIFEPGKSCGDTHGQVGTRRYMAPEVLEGAINFSRDAFLRIDMYACGLVLWELTSRCTATSIAANSATQNLGTRSTNMSSPSSPPSGLVIDEYKLPFEAEASSPTLEQMQTLVVNLKLRPNIKESWLIHPGMAALCDTIKECWDQDAEARLSASCVMERIGSFQRLSFVPPGNLNHNSNMVAENSEAQKVIINNALNNRMNNLPVSFETIVNGSHSTVAIVPTVDTGAAASLNNLKTVNTVGGLNGFPTKDPAASELTPLLIEGKQVVGKETGASSGNTEC